MKKTRGFLWGMMAFSAIAVQVSAGTSTLDRPLDPVVMAGSDLTAFAGVAPTNIVCFTFTNSWHQIPVQVDERVEVSFQQVYNNTLTGMPSSVTFLAYADTNTFTGGDTNTLFDGDDEVVFMAFDAGGRAPAYQPLPSGVVTGSGIEVPLSDPLQPGTGYVYLFESDGSLSPDAGTNYVDYSFSLASGNYKATYSLTVGPNPETSSVTSTCYRTEFSDRWLREVEHIDVGNSDGMDLLNRHRVSLPGNGVARNEDTFDAGEGAFVANIDGPIRCIRSYLGANSGPATQRLHLFYRQRQDIRNFLRVHQGITGPQDTYNYVTGATGMTYYNDHNTNGVSITGGGGTIASNSANWEMVTGGHGTLVFSHFVDTDISGFHQTNYYADNSFQSPPTGTGPCFGMHGPWVNMTSLPSTDPLLGASNHLDSTRIIQYRGTNVSVSMAIHMHNQADTPLQFTTHSFLGDSDSDGMADAWELEHFSDLTHSDSADDDKPAGDGTRNQDEYIAGTDPMDATSFPQLSVSNELFESFYFDAIQADGPGYSGLQRLYTIQMATGGLVGVTWNALPAYSNIPATNQTIGYTNPASHGIRYYRTRITLQGE